MHIGDTTTQVAADDDDFLDSLLDSCGGLPVEARTSAVDDGYFLDSLLDSGGGLTVQASRSMSVVDDGDFLNSLLDSGINGNKQASISAGDDGDFLDSLLDYPGEGDGEELNVRTAGKGVKQSVKIDSNSTVLSTDMSSDSPYTGVLHHQRI
jgi:hypothetical protein